MGRPSRASNDAPHNLELAGVDLPSCPHLGLYGDPGTHAVYPRPDHRCALPGVNAPTLTWQSLYCLDERHAACPHFQMALHGQPLRLSEPTRHNRGKYIASIVGILTLTGVSAAVAVFGLSPSGDVPSSRVSDTDATRDVPGEMLLVGEPTEAEPTATPASTSTSTASRTTNPTASPAPNATVTPSAVPTDTPEVAAAASTTAPLVSPSPQTHTVAGGETLSAIATLYSTTVEILIELNGIADPNSLQVGTVLQLPAQTEVTATPNS